MITSGESTLAFSYPQGGYLTINPERPEDAIAFEESYIRSLNANLQLTVMDPIYYGSWCGRPSYLSYQDIVLATKN